MGGFQRGYKGRGFRFRVSDYGLGSRGASTWGYRSPNVGCDSNYGL